MGRRLLPWLGLVPLAGLTILVLLPVLWMLSTSFQASEKMFQLTMEWIPAAWHPENYPNALHRAPFPLFFTRVTAGSAPRLLRNSLSRWLNDAVCRSSSPAYSAKSARCLS